ncbi:hypothetical protein A2853_02110 [Candidatus Kaiserbacteria bacterium RIFCSPHIGHO2_01_FULL_55_17]|uniref:Chorismate mutase domain-containing protein n=1 Tax=Candidatus Kaiserbacteria bacterium RIFCSPHIGHO2_01_FULL_55_17 TaxID=1798484 RepID=A0A1F6D830_9BACT|nr:MAG: hypothetical protein A2853_02110 [Candidatus Kaiserbacteria bacterium RIFCSPHIGHO2_01_FULL_55_17]
MAEKEHQELNDLRREVDEVDYYYLNKFGELWRALINERKIIVKKIGEYKRHAELGITDKRREAAVILDRTEIGNNKGLPREVTKKMWEHIIEEAKGHE